MAAYDQALALKPDDSYALYNKACAYSKLEDGEASLGWLVRAIKADDSYREKAKCDSDFDYVRQHAEFGPRFRELLGGVSNAYPPRASAMRRSKSSTAAYSSSSSLKQRSRYSEASVVPCSVRSPAAVSTRSAQ